MATFSISASNVAVEFQEGDMALKKREGTRPFYEMCSFVKVREVNVPSGKDVDISDRNNNTQDNRSIANDTKSQDIDEIYLYENMAYNRDV
ncbi:hypothetical protein Gotri_025387 [Gossypium trilobum]|uniref:Uncharacterized protein n=1 Tax=Gossypium trilobum TaxID=34281 RepID=A0A7J9FR06_9ROSI|nr:hypothetical protein [Gossypium trilobum]